MTAQRLVVDLQVLHGTAGLASPAIAPQYLFSQLAVLFRLKSQARPFGVELAS